jgi:2-phosphosulfolactate phosphatase
MRPIVGKTVTTPEPSPANPLHKFLDVAFLPTLLDPQSLTGRIAVVTDVLRATTTIANAIANGAKQVLPQPGIEAARKCQAENPSALLGGERNGKIVAGFHHGNSPIEYTTDVIAGKTLVLATTNGTVAMEHCRSAEKVLIGAMVNVGAVAKAITDGSNLLDKKVTVICSGTDGFITSEDVSFAGALVERLIEREDDRAPENKARSLNLLSDNAKIALDHWQAISRSLTPDRPLADFFREAGGGVNLVRIGHDEDIVFASKIDAVPVVPELNLKTWSIR